MRKEAFIAAVMVLFLFLLNGCFSSNNVNNIECVKDTDCGIGGCSGQVCVPVDKIGDIITTCEFREEYNCLRLTSCSCINESCRWKETPEYKRCVEEVKA